MKSPEICVFENNREDGRKYGKEKKGAGDKEKERDKKGKRKIMRKKKQGFLLYFEEKPYLCKPIIIQKMY
ncbi:hypothetical protein LJC38_07245 [Parabacteroides sp. OttesenSCG-928-K15]|nr:hypothetical protein [Parabacteroides sp. OttesenSCG-928-K15]